LERRTKKTLLGTTRLDFLGSLCLLLLVAIIFFSGSPAFPPSPVPAQAKTQLTNQKLSLTAAPARENRQLALQRPSSPPPPEQTKALPADQHSVSPPAAAAAATKNIPQKPEEKPVENNPSAAPVESVAPAGSLDAATKTELHTVARGESLPSLALHYLPQTPYMTREELEAAIRQANPGKIGRYLRPGDQIAIPGIFIAPLVEQPVPVPKNFEMRGIYLTGYTAGSDKGLELIRRWRAAGGNAVVFDIKDFDGLVDVPFKHPLACEQKHLPIRNLPKLVSFLHSQGLHAIVRIAVFRDECLVQAHNDLAVQSRSTGRGWRENGKLVWTDPSRTEVQDYNLALARMAATSGADEIQFDYVRFPAEGDQKDAQFAFESKHPDWERSDVISKFVARTYSELHPLGVLFSLDVFGVMAWQRTVDLSHTGQDIPAMARFCDVLSPMVYPSHFFGMEGYARPGDAPEHFITESMQRFAEITADSEVVLRPWLQAFAWHTKTYSDAYIRTQVSVARGQGGVGFLFWNARNDYSKLFPAMAEMRAAPGRFFRGDEIQVSHRKLSASLTPSDSGTAGTK
jgi:hypothetical protein